MTTGMMSAAMTEMMQALMRTMGWTVRWRTQSVRVRKMTVRKKCNEIKRGAGDGVGWVCAVCEVLWKSWQAQVKSSFGKQA